MVSNNGLWHSNYAQLVLRGLMYAKKSFPTTSPASTRQDESMDSEFIPKDLSDNVCFSSFDGHCSFIFLFLADRSGTRHGLQLL